MSKTLVIGCIGRFCLRQDNRCLRIKEAFMDNVELLSQDFYYKPYDHLPFEERIKLNYDHPNAFDTDRLINDIRALKEGKAIERPIYSYTEYTRLPETVTVKPSKVIIVEGFMIFENAILRELMDIKIFVDTDADERLIRRIIRDVRERGRTLESVINQYIDTVKPMHEQFVEPFKKYADIIIPRGGMNEVAIDMLIHRIKSSIDES